jgi:hypothetical protein
MSVAIHEREASHDYEVSVDRIDDLQLLRAGLTGIIVEQRLAQRNFSENTDEHKIELAESLREQIAKDMEETLRGTSRDRFTYPVEESEFVREALEIATLTQQKEPKTAQRTIAPRQISSPLPSGTSVPIVQIRVTSFFDPRLDEKRSRWFSR